MIFVIPARKGSKGLPYKNRLFLGGLPLVIRSAKCVIEAGHTPIVSTDDPLIMRMCDDISVECIERPSELCTDDAVTQDAVKHALQGRKEQYVGMLQCTTPFTSPQDIVDCVRLSLDNDWVLTVSPFNEFVMEGCQTVTPSIWARRQDLPPRYIITGGVYIYKTEMLHKWRDLYFNSSSTGLVVVEKLRSLDINDVEDFKYAKYLSSSYDSLCFSWRGDQKQTPNVLVQSQRTSLGYSQREG